MIWRSIAIGAVIVVSFLVFAPAEFPLALGLALGFGFSLLRLYLASNALLVFVATAPKQGQSYMVQRRLFSYFLTAGVLALAFWREEINPWTTAAGLFLTTAVMVFDALQRGRLDASSEEES